MNASSVNGRYALEGYLTEHDGAAHLLGSRCTDCGSYYFPAMTSYCRNPDCDGETLEEVPLSRTGRLWSFTNAAYQPPPPYIPDTDPFEPFAIAAVELEREQMVVLGQLVRGVPLADLEIGMTMELALEPLYRDEEGDAFVWKWRPAAGGRPS